jgi:hypothetical protein
MADVVYPYEILETEPVLSLTHPRVDGKPAQILAREGAVDLFSLDGWREARVNLRLQVPGDELKRLGVTDYAAFASVNCGPTNLRYSIPLERTGMTDQWVGELSLASSLLRDRAELYATVTGVADGTPDRFLGRSAAFRVFLSPPASPEISGGQMPVVWRDFSETPDGQNPIDPALHDEISYFDIGAQDGPVIYLNTRVSGLRRLLEERPGRSALERSVRDVVLDGIAQGGMMAMFSAAVTAVRANADEGRVEWPAADWQKGVLETLLPLVYPDREAEAGLQTAVESMDSGEDAEELQARLQAATLRYLKTTRHLVRMIKTLESVADEEEE